METRRLSFGWGFTAIVLGGFAGLAGAYYYHLHGVQTSAVHEAEVAQQAVRTIPLVTSTSTPSQKPTRGATAATSTIQGAFNLAVPFISQAPQKVWDVLHEDYCEEASLLMLQAYGTHANWTVADQETKLAAIHDWEMTNFGHFESTSAAEVARIAKEFLKFKKVTVVENPTYDQIHTAVAAGHPVILPTDGKALHNPYFKNGGPAYHMLVVRGYTPSGDIIVNDPGTQHGENYVYKKDVLMAAIHDWNHGPTDHQEASGTPRMIVVE